MSKIFVPVAVAAILVSVAGQAAVAPENELQRQHPTVVFGASQTAPGVGDAVEVIQKDGARNPLGNPISDGAANSSMPKGDLMDENKSDFDDRDYQKNTTPETFKINQDSQQNPSIEEEPNPAAQADKIQNTLYESGGRIYDLQSYPDGDVKKLESAEQPTIDNYPAY